MKLLLSILLTFLCCTAAEAQTRITTSTGNVYSGWMQYEDAQSVRILTTDSIVVTLTRDKIAKIEYGQPITSIELKPGDAIPAPVTGTLAAVDESTSENTGSYTGMYGYRPLNGANAEEPEPRSYYGIGASFGLPGWANLVGSYTGPSWAYRVSAGGIPDLTFGGQIHIGKRYNRDEQFDVIVGLFAGHHEFDQKEDSYFYDRLVARAGIYSWTYIGPYIELNLIGFFVDGGLAIGFGDYRLPQLWGQLGYALRLDAF